MFVFNVGREESNHQDDDLKDDLRKRVKSLKTTHRDHLYTVLNEEVEQYEKIINLYEDELKHLHRENKKTLCAKNAELKKLKKVSATQNCEILLDCSNYCFRLNSSTLKSSELQKEFYLRALANFKAFVEDYDQEEDKLFSMKIELLSNLKTSLTEEEFRSIQEDVKKQEEMNENQYRQQVDELEVSERMMNILLESEKMKDLVYIEIEQMENEVDTLFKDIRIVSSEEDRKKISEVSKVEETIKWQDANALAEKEEFEHQRKELEGICNPIFTQLYQGAGESSSLKIPVKISVKPPEQKLTTSVEPVDEFVMQDTADTLNTSLLDFGNEENGDNAVPESNDFLFEMGDKDDEKEFSFNF